MMPMTISRYGWGWAYGDRRVTAPSRALRVRAYASGSTASRRARTTPGVGSKLLPNKGEGSADMRSA
jgi:hypothetical protein